MSNCVLSLDNSDPYGVHTHDTLEAHAEVATPSTLRGEERGCRVGESIPDWTRGLESKVGPWPPREHQVKAVPGRPALWDLLSDLGEATETLDPFPQLHHTNPNFLSLRKGEDVDKNTSVKAQEKRWQPLPLGPRSPAHPAENVTLRQEQRGSDAVITHPPVG